MKNATLNATLITQERIDELEEQLQDGAATDEGEREIWQAAKMVPALVDMLRACIEQLDCFDVDLGQWAKDASELRADASFLIGE